MAGGYKMGWLDGRYIIGMVHGRRVLVLGLLLAAIKTGLGGR